MIIGLLGYISSGKGTVADKLEQHHDFTKDSFAHSLKDACAVMFNWPRNLLEGDTDESRWWRDQVDTWWASKLNIPDFTPRLALQLVGTNALRDHFHPDMWLLSLENRLQNNNDNIAISDARFPNEIKLIKELDGKIVQVIRGEEPAWVKTATFANAGDELSLYIMETVYKDVHKSEWAWAGTIPDVIIDNNGLITDLDNQIANLFN